jgi:AraC family transcriptional activator of pobA
MRNKPEKMDAKGQRWYYSDMKALIADQNRIPSWHLYGEERAFPDILHCEKITDRAAGLDWIIAPHRHPHLHQFFLIRTGEVEMNADGKKLNPATPCIVNIPRGTVHGFSFSAGTDGYVATIPLQSLPELFDPNMPGTASLSHFSVIAADTELMALFDALHQEHEARHATRTTMLRAQASMLACQIIRNMPDENKIAQTGHTQKFQTFKSLTQTHLRDGWQLRDYAKALNLSTRHLGRICRKATGQSPTEYLEATLMQEACRMLVYTRDNISNIGYQLGFEDPSYFSRSFRRYMGLTPREYRLSFEEE